MKIGFLPEKDKEYLCRRNRVDTIIEKFKFPDQDYYLISTESQLRGDTVHIKIPIDHSLVDKIRDRVAHQEMYFRIPTGIIVNNYNLLRLSAYASKQQELKNIELVTAFIPYNIPIMMSRNLGDSDIVITTEPTGMNII